MTTTTNQERDEAMREDDLIMRRFELWFFRDLSDEQRQKLFRVQGIVPAGEEVRFESMQKRTLRYLVEHAKLA
jgi:hypothetical protein